MWQIVIDGQDVGKPMKNTDAIRWRSILKVHFPNSLIIWQKVS
jgi:hypothetical protein